MKKIILVLIVMLSVSSCVSKKKADILLSQKDSLSVVLQARDSMLNEALNSISDIAGNLNDIKTKEDIVTAMGSDTEIHKDVKAQIFEDIQSIGSQLEQNRKDLDNLNKRLRAANVKNEGLEKLISQLHTQINIRDKEIAELKKSLNDANIKIDELSNSVAELSTSVQGLVSDKQVLANEVKKTQDELNTVYVVIDNEKTLMKKNIIDKHGFIGRTVTKNNDSDMSMFAKLDSRQVSEIAIGEKKAKVVTSHPTDSYLLIKDRDNKIEKLVIKDKKAFWSSSKVLVISYK